MEVGKEKRSQRREAEEGLTGYKAWGCQDGFSEMAPQWEVCWRRLERKCWSHGIPICVLGFLTNSYRLRGLKEHTLILSSSVCGQGCLLLEVSGERIYSLTFSSF